MYHGTAFTKMRLFFHSLLHYEHIFFQLCVRYRTPDAFSSSLKHLNSSGMLNFSSSSSSSSSSSAKQHHQGASFSRPKRWKTEITNSDCRKTRDNSPPHHCNHHPCAQTGVQPGIVMHQRNLIHLLFGCTLRICCFNLLNVCTYHSEFITAPLSTNSSNKIPSLSHKTLAMTLPTEICASDFFSCGDN